MFSKEKGLVRSMEAQTPWSRSEYRGDKVVAETRIDLTPRGWLRLPPEPLSSPTGKGTSWDVGGKGERCGVCYHNGTMLDQTWKHVLISTKHM